MRKQQMKGIEVRFRKAQELMRRLRVTSETKGLQKDIAFTMQEIEQYGFEWFPNHYVGDQIIQFEAMINQLKEHTSTNYRK